MLKVLNYNIQEQLKCWIHFETVKVNIKDVKHIGFVGEFKVNFNIPEYFGIGKNISKGFGTVKKRKWI